MKARPAFAGGARPCASSQNCACRQLTGISLPRYCATRIRRSSLRTAWVGLEAGDGEDKRYAARRVVDVLPRVDWLLQGDIESWFLGNFEAAKRAVMDEITLRRAEAHKTQAGDNVLRLLIAVLEAKKIQRR